MPAPEKTVTITPDQIQEQPTREISQTDHLNKKLLTSLFKLLDEGGDSKVSKMLESDNNAEDEAEWED